MTTITEGNTSHPELLNSHRSLFESFLNNNEKFKLGFKKQVLRLYDTMIHKDNIIYFYNRRIQTFLIALVSDRLDDIKDYFYKNTLIQE